MGQHWGSEVEDWDSEVHASLAGDALTETEDKVALQQAMKKMHPNQKAALLGVLAGKSNREIGQELQLGTVNAKKLAKAAFDQIQGE